ncbi:hemerythrin domain-containing protein [Trujillonella endophytica]|uniref:Hemerythrin HHE cation binding domain-containing protein n=1 Tax=Trujillonella endophytica TaxID=673521 RepID=A0A1H8VKI8_9ACTN|nr:hemerythrin domain-containing protein [Trujillella endophytica]SEP15889.1 Hemerythrin HHE cation binding domain-containing protein [Trujillella endophytica]
MTGPAVLPRSDSPAVPIVSTGNPAAAPAAAPAPAPAPARPAAYEHVLHRLVRREVHLLGELSTWAAPDDAPRAAALAAHAHLVGRLLLQHHATERDLIWPALLRSLPDGPGRARVAEETARCARLDDLARGLSTAARQWTVTGTAAARDAFTLACRALADAVDDQTATEEHDLLPLLAALPAAEWTAITAAAPCSLSGRERLFVLGLALEDACADERARLLAALPPATRLAWRLAGRRRYRAAVVRLRGAPPAG